MILIFLLQKWFFESLSNFLTHCYLPPNGSLWPNSVNYLERLRSQMQKLQPVPTRSVFNYIFIPTEIKSYYIFLRHDAARKPLQSIYDGPFPVLQRDETTFTIFQTSTFFPLKSICFPFTLITRSSRL
ncbi:unnamed protein product [Hymenolepis diminuta]|uniref:Uncharacterized protein n=1 Tax=Hymenolepis diminuta TaxID=6216 RepID=A0A564YZW6_HYMDI|nr:unnamed protein product [Hymenolepis diminuta]